MTNEPIVYDPPPDPPAEEGFALDAEASTQDADGSTEDQER